MRKENRLIKSLAVCALACGLSLSAKAQLGTGWTPDNETYTQQTSTGTVNGVPVQSTITPIFKGYEFTIPAVTGLFRAEMRGNNLPTTTTNQWQGLGTLASFPAGANKICMHQVFGPAPTTPDLILDEAVGGPTGVEIVSLEQGDAFEASISIGAQFQLNTIYDPVHSLIYTYVNGSQTGTKTANAGVHYNKYGQYVSSSGAGPSTFDWVNVQSWSGGTLPTEFPPVLVSPANGLTGVALTPTFTWNAAPGAVNYTVAISLFSRFTNQNDITYIKGVTGTSAKPSTALKPNYTYYWKVGANYPGGDVDWSPIWSFTTGN